jgi:hypothetical protein
MVVVLSIGGSVGWIVYRARVQRDAVTAIQRAGRWAYYDWQVMEGTPVTDASLPTLAGLPSLTNVRLSHSDVTDTGLANFHKDRRRIRVSRALSLTPRSG